MVKNAFEYKFGLFLQTPVITGIAVIAEKNIPAIFGKPFFDKCRIAFNIGLPSWCKHILFSPLYIPFTSCSKHNNFLFGAR